MTRIFCFLSNFALDSAHPRRQPRQNPTVSAFCRKILQITNAGNFPINPNIWWFWTGYNHKRRKYAKKCRKFLKKVLILLKTSL